MKQLNENIFHQYNKWKQGYSRKENSFKLRVRNFLSNREDANKFKISKDGKHLNASDTVRITDDDISDGKLPVPFGKVNWNFDCMSCTSLTSLEGAPKYVENSFDCNNCENLTSLVGAPEEVGGDFSCSECPNLTSLVGAPKKVGGIFDCSDCKKLKSLEGAPKEVGGAFDCNDCKNLTSLVGVPKKIDGYFDCSGCKNLTSLEGLPKEIGGNLYIDGRFKGKIPDDVIVKGEINYHG